MRSVRKPSGNALTCSDTRASGFVCADAKRDPKRQVRG